MSNRLKIALASILVIIALVAAYSAGCIQGVGFYRSSGSGAGLQVVEEAWNILFNNYVEPDKLDEQALSQAAINGMLAELDDPYTAYLEPSEYELSISGLSGTFDGIGAYIGMDDEDRLIILAPIPGSPAEKAGIRAGDIILEIDGRSTEGMSSTEAVLFIRGPAGTAVALLLQHEDEAEPVEIRVVRAEIEPASVIYEMEGDIAYIRITQFTVRTDEELSPVLAQAVADHASGIILDLRDNPGGILQSVVDIASHFIDSGVVVSVRDNRGEVTPMRVEETDIETDLPVVVLVNRYSASGSEVLSGALQDHGRAVIAGETTYGKGSVNILRSLSDGSGLYITTARWLTPDGNLIEGEGVTPDIALDFEQQDGIEWALDYLRDNS